MAASPAVVAPSDQLLKSEELDALVAPIALYPDSLLALVFMASTYPLEVVQADRWLKDNKNLKGDQLKTAVDKQSWDDSVKSLVASPDVLSMLSSKLSWTVKLGDAVLAQQPDLMDAVQRLRTRAEANNKLTSNTQQKVSKSPGPGGRQTIVIEQTDPDMLYVPYYDPAVVYGGWPYPDYPPYAFGYPPYIGAGLIATGLAFGAGWALGRWGAGGNYWGGGFNWNINNININRPRVNPLGGNNWQHRPEHRAGVRYNNSNVRQRYGNNRTGVQNRMDFRGRSGQSGSQAWRWTAAECGPTTVWSARCRATSLDAAECGQQAFHSPKRRKPAFQSAERRPTAGGRTRRKCVCQYWIGESEQHAIVAWPRKPWRGRISRSGWRRISRSGWRRIPRGGWRRIPRRWRWLPGWRRRTAFRYHSQARYRPARSSAERPWVLSLQL